MRGYKTVTNYITIDGKLHTSKEVAELWVKECIGSRISTLIKKFLQQNQNIILKGSDVIKLTEFLYERRDEFKIMLEMETAFEDDEDDYDYEESTWQELNKNPKLEEKMKEPWMKQKWEELEGYNVQEDHVVLSWTETTVHNHEFGVHPDDLHLVDGIEDPMELVGILRKSATKPYAVSWDHDGRPDTIVKD
jgi:hypothetical protein